MDREPFVVYVLLFCIPDGVYLYDLATTDCFNLAVVLQESNKRVQSIQNGCKYRNVMRSEAFELATPLYTAFYCCTSTD